MSCNPASTPEQEQNRNSSPVGTSVILSGETVHTVGKLPDKGAVAPDFTLTANDLSYVSLNDYKGKNVILNIFPSIDTKVCSMSVRTFNERAAGLNNTVVLCVSKDLPYAQSRFCGTEGIENAITLSDFRSDFGIRYGVQLADGRMAGLLSRAVVVIDTEGRILYTEQVPNIGQEPDYDAAMAAVES